jgi:dihydroorotate dehydrogenase electron transfer subunit
MTGPARQQLDILDARSAGTDYRWIRLAAPPGWHSVPGQFVNILCTDTSDAPPPHVLDYGDTGPRPKATDAESRCPTPLIRRPVSISTVTETDGRQTEIGLLIRVVGPGSRLLAKRRPGDTLDVIGPLGNGFDLTVPERRAFLVGGGCGIAPLVGLARALAAAGKQVTVFYGANSADNVPLGLPTVAKPTGDRATTLSGVAEFPDAEFVLATDDGSAGFAGLVTGAMAAYGADHPWSDAAVYVCGPDVMMAAVAELAQANNVSHCEVSLENYMGCGIGVCLSCATKVRADNDQGWTYKQVCRDGPVFQAADVIFESKQEGCTR